MYVRRRPRVRIEPLQNGGGQERGLRSGTVPTPLVVGLGAACEIAQQELEVETSELVKLSSASLSLLTCVSFPVYFQYDHKRVTVLANRLVQKIMSEIPDVMMNGDPDQRYPGKIRLSNSPFLKGSKLT